MFNQSKYSRWYQSIITRAATRETLTEGEKHHPIPISIGGDRKMWVMLTPREHFVCHWLLTKMVDQPQHKKKMNWAFHLMLFSNNPFQQRYRPCSHVYEQFRKQFYQSIRGQKRVLSEEHKRNIAEANRKRLKGKKLPEAWRQKMSEAHIGQVSPNKGKLSPLRGRKLPESVGKAISKTLTGRKLSDEHKRNISVGLKRSKVQAHE